MVVVGRYRSGGPATITLEGTVNDRIQTFRYEDLSFARNGGQDFIPRLWATRKIGYLLNQIRLHGETKEAINQIVNLSIRYGIITPYTSFLVEEPEDALTERGREVIIEEEREAAAEEALAPSFGAGAVEKAVEGEALESADMAAPVPMAMPTASPGEPGGGEGRVAAVPMVAAVGDKAFILRDGVWTDTTFDLDRMRSTKLQFASPEFMDFLAAHPEAGKFFALSERVTVVIDGAAYETTPADPEAVSAEPAAVEPAAVGPVVPTEEGVSSAAVANSTPAKADPTPALASTEVVAFNQTDNPVSPPSRTGLLLGLIGGGLVVIVGALGAVMYILRRSG
jgi:Ca-activated chloride channel family protein